jgi:hypothetical protein
MPIPSLSLRVTDRIEISIGQFIVVLDRVKAAGRNEERMKAEGGRFTA